MVPIGFKTYEKMCDAYRKSGTIEAVAQVEGIGRSAATRFVLRGDPANGQPAIQQRVKEENERAIEAAAATRRKTLEIHAAMSAHFTGKQLAAMKKVGEVDPVGKWDAGTQTFKITTDELARLIRTGRMLFDYTGAVQDAQNVVTAEPTTPANIAAVQVNVNANGEQVEVNEHGFLPRGDSQQIYDTVLKFARVQPIGLMSSDASVRTDTEHAAITALAQASSVRERAAAIPDEDDDLLS